MLLNGRVCHRPVRQSDRCTNVVCLSCHGRFCTPGGITTPGHSINLPEARDALAKATQERSRE